MTSPFGFVITNVAGEPLGGREDDLEAFDQKPSGLFVEPHVHERVVLNRRFVRAHLGCDREARRDDDANSKDYFFHPSCSA